jgi:predicted transcriptional regulator
MEKILSSRATNWREGRRLRAWELHQKGWQQQAIAEALGVTQGAVSQWLKRVKEDPLCQYQMTEWINALNKVASPAMRPL